MNIVILKKITSMYPWILTLMRIYLANSDVQFWHGLSSGVVANKQELEKDRS